MATSDKYDRQLRLWGAAGQRALSHAHILLIQADSVGSETLKNLVLPGVGAITILDDHRVSEDDLGSCFFVDSNGLGRPRAEVVCELLCEMNTDVRGFAKVGHFQNVFKTEPEFFDQFTLIIASNLTVSSLQPLAERCWAQYRPLLRVSSNGFFGAVQLQLREHVVLDCKNESVSFDWRVAGPVISGLEELCAELLGPLDRTIVLKSDERSAGSSAAITAIDSHEYSHVPFPLLLRRVLSLWQRETGSEKSPTSATEKQRLRDLLDTLHLVPTQQNIVEARKELIRSCCVSTHLDRSMFSDVSMDTGDDQSPEEDDFDPAQADSWSRLLHYLRHLKSEDVTQDIPRAVLVARVLLLTLKAFLLESHGMLPVGDSLPDVTATSGTYLLLQRLYLNAAGRDRERFSGLLHDILEKYGLPADTVAPEAVTSFCRQIRQVSVVQTPPLYAAHSAVAGQELRRVRNQAATLTQDILDEEFGDVSSDGVQNEEVWRYSHPWLWDLAMQAAELFAEQQGRWPGDGQHDSEDALSRDSDAVYQLLVHLGTEWYGLNPAHFETVPASTTAMETSTPTPASVVLLPRILVREVVRWGRMTSVNVSSIVGGVAAQEATKILTQCFVPLDFKYLVNGQALRAVSQRV